LLKAESMEIGTRKNESVSAMFFESLSEFDGGSGDFTNGGGEGAGGGEGEGGGIVPVIVIGIGVRVSVDGLKETRRVAASLRFEGKWESVD